MGEVAPLTEAVEILEPVDAFAGASGGGDRHVERISPIGGRLVVFDSRTVHVRMLASSMLACIDTNVASIINACMYRYQCRQHHQCLHVSIPMSPASSVLACIDTNVASITSACMYRYQCRQHHQRC
jgi:hypothetical protein